MEKRNTSIDMKEVQNTMYYSIGQFSKMTKTTIATLRFYEKENILKPIYKDPNSGYRYYASSQLNDLQRIISLRQINLSIEEIHQVLHKKESNDILLDRKNELLRKKAELQKLIKRIDFMIQGDDKYEVIIKEIESCMVYSCVGQVKSNLDLYDFIQSTEKTIFDANPDLKRASPDYCFLSYLDNEYKTKNMTVEYCQATNICGKDTEKIHFKRLPGCKVACLYYRGSNEYIGEGFTYLYDWIDKSGYTPCQAPRECYIDGLWNVDDVNQWLTEIQIPIM